LRSAVFSASAFEYRSASVTVFGMRKAHRNRIAPLLVVGFAVSLAVAGCSSSAATSIQPAASQPALPAASPTRPAWFDVPLTDVNSGRSFRVSDFAGKVVLVETMATWCPTCQGEMSQVQQLHRAYPASDFVSVCLDVDPNEDAALLKKYAAANGFDWLIAIAPEKVGQFLATNYDVNFLNPPLQPMLIVDRQGSVWGLPFGIKSYASLKQTIDPYLAR
jgi:cytochrome oxidase Cu insertion factor (SCO1/SenC/PrrC family)